MFNDAIEQIVLKNAKIEVSKQGNYTKIKIKSNKYCDKVKIWVSLNETFKNREDVIIEVE
ncbi:MAG: hypothetical protein QXH75_05135 [Sulfolobaceae archaeon]|jgi:hypothetical protein